MSLLLALLRKKLAEFDASGGDTRLVLSRDEIVELVRVFLPERQQRGQTDRPDRTPPSTSVELGLPAPAQPGGQRADLFEVRRILKAFVDAQWLADFDARLAAYRRAARRATARSRR